MNDQSSDAIATLLGTTKVAVLVIDKQIGYAVREAGTDWPAVATKKVQALLPKLDDFIAAMRQRRLPIIWTKMVENSNESPANIAFKIRVDGDVVLTETGKPSFAIVGEQPLATEKVVIKKHYDAFTATDLNEYLLASGITTLILTGAYASRCVLATAFMASSLGYNVLLLEDLIANPDAFDSEFNATLTITKAILGFVTDSSALLRALSV